MKDKSQLTRFFIISMMTSIFYFQTLFGSSDLSELTEALHAKDVNKTKDVILSGVDIQPLLCCSDTGFVQRVLDSISVSRYRDKPGEGIFNLNEKNLEGLTAIESAYSKKQTKIIHTLYNLGGDISPLQELLLQKNTAGERSVGEIDLCRFVERKNKEQVCLLLNLGVDIHYLLMSSDEDFIQKTLRHLSISGLGNGKFWNLNKVNEEGKTPLEVAFDKGNFVAVEYLLKMKAHSLPLIEKLKQDSLGEKLLLEAVSKKNQQFASLLLGLDGNLHLLLQSDDTGFVRNVLLNLDENMSNRTVYCDFNRKNEEGKTPVEIAYQSHLSVVPLLLKHGANIHPFVRFFNLNEVKRILETTKVNVNACNEKGESVLKLAMTERNIPMIVWLLERGADMEPLFAYSNPEFMKCILEECSHIKSLNLNKTNDHGKTLIQIAFEKGHTLVVDQLLSMEAQIHPLILLTDVEFMKERIEQFNINLNLPDSQDHTLLDIIATHKPDNKEMMTLLVSSGANIHPLIDPQFFGFFKGLLETVSVNLNTPNNKLEKPIYLAVEKAIQNMNDTKKFRDILDIISFLSNSGADMLPQIKSPLLMMKNKKIRDKITKKLRKTNLGKEYLSQAISAKNQQLTGFFLALGGDIHILLESRDKGFVEKVLSDFFQNQDLWTVYTDCNRRNERGETPLYVAGYLGHHFSVMKSLVQLGANIHSFAFFDFNDHIVDFLEKKSVDVDALNDQGFSPLMAAIMGGNIKMIVWLLEQGADIKNLFQFYDENSIMNVLNDCQKMKPQINLNRKNKNGQTLVEVAFRGGYYGVTDQLLSMGAQIHPLILLATVNAIQDKIPRLSIDVNARDREEKTPLYFAVQMAITNINNIPLYTHSLNMIKLLLAYGADIDCGRTHSPLQLTTVDDRFKEIGYTLLLDTRPEYLSHITSLSYPGCKWLENGQETSMNSWRDRIISERGLTKSSQNRRISFANCQIGSPKN